MPGAVMPSYPSLQEAPFSSSGSSFQDPSQPLEGETHTVIPSQKHFLTVFPKSNLKKENAGLTPG